MCPRQKKAFTLIELLVVIAIIALLMAILMPMLSRARKQTRAVACMSNLRHWGLIFKMYTDDNNHQFYGAWSTSQQGHVWIGALKPYY
ncbi:MAG: type II secretion system protein, partial [Planctomycetota bacterium]